jgi:hypothetical protein
MTELHNLEEYNFENVKSFIDNEIEESIHIDFKAAGALSRMDSKKKEISKDVSAFANSDGGIIIYGISEKNHKASEFSFIDGNEFTKEWLEQIISTTINRNIPNLKIYPIRKDGNIQQTIYVVKIPASLEAPHLSRDKKFYKRYNFESVAMEEYEIRQLYGRKVQSKLEIDTCTIDKVDLNEDGKNRYSVDLQVHNSGEKMEENYKINFYFLNFSTKDEMEISWNRSDAKVTKLDDNRIKVTGDGNSPIYPNETLSVLKFEFSISKENFNEKIKDLKSEIRLFYPGGTGLVEFDLSKSLENWN